VKKIFSCVKEILSAVADWLYPPRCVACGVLLALNEPARYVCVDCVDLFEVVTTPFCGRCGAPVKTKDDAGESTEAEGVIPPNAEGWTATGTITTGGAEIKSCASCMGRIFFFERNIAAFIYDDLMREMLHDMKFRAKKRVATGLGQVWGAAVSNNVSMANVAAANKNVAKCDDLTASKNVAFCDNFICHENPFRDFILVPVPMHKKKQRERGFNQAEIMTLELAKKISVPVSNALVRTFDTPPQSELHPSQRVENVTGVFALAKNHDARGKSYILTDDIFTTGASINECAKVLKNAGAERVLCMTLCITVKKSSEK